MAEEDFRHSQVTVNGSELHVVETGDPHAPPILFLHGWPESWSTWRSVMTLAADRFRALAIDLPGIGGSTGEPTDGSKQELSNTVHGLVTAMGLTDLTLVGHDCGAMIAYPCARSAAGPVRVVLMDSVIPGVDPWDAVLANPYIWHFAFHSIAALPEHLVQGRQREYFDYFFDVLSPEPAKIGAAARAASAAAYFSDSALTAGFNWYRTFAQDAAANRAAAGGSRPAVGTPLLYVRGEKESGRIEDYLAGFRAAGGSDVRGALVPGAGHFPQQESPAELWSILEEFISSS